MVTVQLEDRVNVGGEIWRYVQQLREHDEIINSCFNWPSCLFKFKADKILSQSDFIRNNVYLPQGIKCSHYIPEMWSKIGLCFSQGSPEEQNQ